MNAIDDYLAAQPEPQRTTLAALRTTIAALLPRAEESIAYGAPAWKVDGGTSVKWSHLGDDGTPIFLTNPAILEQIHGAKQS